MKTQDLIDQLEKMGVKNAQGIVSGLPAGEYVNLINALNQPDPLIRNKAVAEVLKPYGVKNMTSENDYLSTMFSKFREGKTNISQELLGEWLKPISESTAPDAPALARDGFNYFMHVEDAASGERLMDWLDENKVEYMTDGKGQFHIKCSDRESAYRVGKAANGLVSKKIVVRDQIEETSFPIETTKGTVMVQGSDEFAAKRNAQNQGYELVEAKSAKQREADAKKKMADIKPRNQDLLALSQRGGKGAHKSDPRKDDKFDRKAKHKKSPVDEAPELSTDNMVLETETLEESVLGMKPLNPIFRLRELAGMAPAPAVAPEMDDLSDIEIDHDDSGFNDPLAAGPVGAEPDMGAETGALAAGPVDVEDPFTAGIDGVDAPAGIDAPLDTPLDAPLDAPMGGAPEMGGVPGDLPPMGAEAPLMEVPTQSDAMSHIEDCLNDIQGKLAEIRLAEYKSLVQKLTSLTQQVQTMGRDYLGEQRRKK